MTVGWRLDICKCPKILFSITLKASESVPFVLYYSHLFLLGFPWGQGGFWNLFLDSLVHIPNKGEDASLERPSFWVWSCTVKGYPLTATHSQTGSIIFCWKFRDLSASLDPWDQKIQLEGFQGSSVRECDYLGLGGNTVSWSFGSWEPSTFNMPSCFPVCYFMTCSRRLMRGI